MIRLFIGTPGAGKTYGALKDILEELLYGVRMVITNAPLLTPVLNEYIAKHHPEWKDDINLRVRLISEGETKQFYRYRGVTGDIGTVSREDSLAGRHLPYDQYRGDGVLYVIDEAHIPFDSREWADTGPELTFYNSQHRKLNDELIFITQFEKLIDVRVRGFVQDFCYFQNMGMEKFLTVFRKPAMFCMEVHRKPPSGNNAPPPNERHFYKMDFELAKCYDTSAGVGIKGRKLPEKKKKGGFNVLWLLAAGVIVAGLLMMVPRAIKWAVGASMPSHEAVKAPKDKGLSALVKETVSPSERKVPPSELANAVPRGTKPDLEVVGVVYRGRRIAVQLANGDILTESDGVQAFDRSRVKIAGKWYALKANKNARSAPISEKKELTPTESPPELPREQEQTTVKISGDTEDGPSERPGEYTYNRSYYGNSGRVQNTRQETVAGRAGPSNRSGSEKPGNRGSSGGVSGTVREAR